MTPLLEAQEITKRYGALAVLQNVSLELSPGEVVGLAGLSGSGKTMLTRAVAGLLVPDSGQIVFDGRALSWPFQPHKVGISVIHQKPKLADQFDIPSNIFLGRELTRSFLGGRLRLLDQARMHEEARRILALLDVDFPNLHQRAGELPGDERQLVSIAQGMATPARLRVVDDPTDTLSAPYQARLLSLIDAWQQEGLAVLFSSRDLDHLFAVTDRIIVLRHGKVAANLPTDETSREEIVDAMVGSSDRQQYTPVIWALDSYYKAKQQAEMLQHQQQLLQEDLAARDSINQQLLAQLTEQVRTLDSANLALQNAQRRLLTQRELERKHLSRELHDETIQDLLSLNYQIEEITSLAGGDERLVAELDDLRRNIRQLVTSIRGICGDLRPPTIDSLGLGAALKSYTAGWSQRMGIAVDLSLSGNFGRLPEAIELSVFRIIQESLNNVWKHSGASRVRVDLAYTSPRMLAVTVADNGRGLTADFDLSASSLSGHYGLLGISERVALLGGRLSIQNQSGSGLSLCAEIPHPRVVLETAT